MGSNNNQNQGYGPNANPSGSDPKGVGQNQSQYQQKRYENQQGPMVTSFAQNYGQGAEQGMGDYTDIMNRYADIASNPGAGGGASGAYGGPGYSAFNVTPGTASYKDPFASYSDYQDWSKTGGYSGEDISNMRSRGVSPIRAAYANAEREVGRQRSLQGGYSANAGALQARMAREQGQSAADATTNVEAGLAEARNRGRQFGLQGMTGIEGQRLGADVDLSKFNTGLDYQGQVHNAAEQARAQEGNIGIGRSNAAAGASASNQAAALASQRQMGSLAGMANLYGTTPGMAQTFGNQLLAGVGQGGDFGNNLYRNDIMNQQAPGQFEQTMGRIGNIASMAGNAAYPFLDYFGNRNQQPDSSYWGGSNQNPSQPGGIMPIGNPNLGRQGQFVY